MKIGNKGQALVEFIIIVPVLLLVLLALVDFGSIIHQRYVLENDIDIVSDMYEDNKMDDINSYINKIDASISYENDNKYVTIKLEKKANYITGIISNIMGNNYKITASKTIIKESAQMNNRGQSLVTFILILPIILIITSLAIDYGMVSIDKRMISNNMKSSIKYGLKHEEKNF